MSNQEDAAVLWQLERYQGGLLTQTQSFSTQLGALTYELEPGRYRLSAQANGQNYAGSFTLVRGETTTLDLQPLP